MPPDADPFDLDRFVDAQDGVYPTVLSELRAGRKRSHWMWFVFPQVQGLGSSPTARRYAIDSWAEAQAFLRHPVLGPRLAECTELLLTHAGTPVDRILGYPDDLKLRSSLTLFAEVAEITGEAGAGVVFRRALDAFFGGRPDERSLAILEAWRSVDQGG